MSDKFNFKKGDVVVAKDDFLNPGETLKDTLGVVVSYNPDNDYLVIGEIFKGNHVLNHTFSARGEFYRLVTPKELKEFDLKEENKMSETKRIVNKILEGADVRKTLSLTESNTTSMKVQSFVDVFFSDNVDYSIVANEFVWFNALLDMSKEIQADFNKTFEDEDLEWDEWFYTHWGVSIDFEFDDLAAAPDCDKAGLSSADLSYYVATHCDVDYVDQYGGDLYLVAKPFV